MLWFCNKLHRLLTYNKVCLILNMAEIAILSQRIFNVSFLQLLSSQHWFCKSQSTKKRGSHQKVRHLAHWQIQHFQQMVLEGPASKASCLLQRPPTFMHWWSGLWLGWSCSRHYCQRLHESGHSSQSSITWNGAYRTIYSEESKWRSWQILQVSLQRIDCIDQQKIWGS